ncbi:hypothetical protein OFC13_27045, partial [Escherichia coli]|nr:hypothetical protein [Escherichia coli]
MPWMVLFSVSRDTSKYVMLFKHVPIPMSLGVFVERSEHDGENDLDIVAHEIAEVLVVPEIQSSLGDLEVRAGNRFGELMEQRLLEVGEVRWVNDVEDV